MHFQPAEYTRPRALGTRSPSIGQLSSHISAATQRRKTEGFHFQFVNIFSSLPFGDCMASRKRVHTTAASRLRQDYIRIVKDPVPYITALPLPSNILEWFVQICFANLAYFIIRRLILLFSFFFILCYRLVFYLAPLAGIMSFEVLRILLIQV